MKITTIFSILMTTLIPITLSATAIRVHKLQRPDGNGFVTIIGDIHLTGKDEVTQREALLTLLSQQPNAHLAVEDMAAITKNPNGFPTNCFLPRLVKNAHSCGIDAISLEFRLLYEESLKETKKRLLLECTKLETLQSAICHDELNKIKEALAQSDPDVTTFTVFCDLAESLFNYVSLAHITDDSRKDANIYICIGDDHAVFLQDTLIKMGYKEIFHISRLPLNNDYLRDRTVTPDTIDNYALNLADALIGKR
jgi:hypothetical protein